MMPPCIFCSILEKVIPTDFVYEDEHIAAFLDIHPTKKGHTLVIPKKHSKTFLETDPRILSHMVHGVQKVAHAAIQAVGAEGCNITVNNGEAAGQIIFHLHWHIIPRNTDDGLVHWPHASYENGEAKIIAEKIKKLLV
jgi:histidine triad (HIT) family protein